MQLGQLRGQENEKAKTTNEVLKADLELLPVYGSHTNISRMSEEEAGHLKALKIIRRTLSKFDLSKNEIRVYLFLARFGPQKAQRIAEALGVHRTEAYKILHRLERQGLISCAFERPMKFVAVSFDRALQNLIEEKRHQIHMMERRKKELVDIWLALPKPGEIKIQSESFQVLEGKRQTSVKANELLDGCSKELLTVLSDKHLLWLYNSPFFDDLEKASKKRKLDICILSNFTPTSEYVLENVNLGDGDFAYYDGEEAPSFIITDNHQMILLMNHLGDVEDKLLGMWTNYSSIVKAFRLLFTLLWKK